MRAYQVTIKGWDLVLLCAAATRGKAIAQCYNGALEAGYQVAWIDLRATRAPKHDTWAATQTEPGKVIDWP